MISFLQFEPPPTRCDRRSTVRKGGRTLLMHRSAMRIRVQLHACLRCIPASGLLRHFMRPSIRSAQPLSHWCSPPATSLPPPIGCKAHSILACQRPKGHCSMLGSASDCTSRSINSSNTRSTGQCCATRGTTCTLLTWLEAAETAYRNSRHEACTDVSTASTRKRAWGRFM